MKKILVSILLLLSILAMTTPAAADQKVRIGTKFNVFTGSPTTFTAGTPFHIAHGYVQIPSTTDGIGVFDFKLEVDGVWWKEDFVERSVISGDPDLLTRIWVFNFPAGMAAGSHVFTGHWFAPCQALVAAGVIPGPCSSPSQKIEEISRSLIVTFLPQ